MLKTPGHFFLRSVKKFNQMAKSLINVVIASLIILCSCGDKENTGNGSVERVAGENSLPPGKITPGDSIPNPNDSAFPIHK
jgi:hypothetical protein